MFLEMNPKMESVSWRTTPRATTPSVVTMAIMVVVMVSSVSKVPATITSVMSVVVMVVIVMVVSVVVLSMVPVPRRSVTDIYTDKTYRNSKQPCGQKCKCFFHIALLCFLGLHLYIV